MEYNHYLYKQRNKALKVNKWSFLYTIMLIPFFEPTYFKDVTTGWFAVIDELYRYSYYIVAVWIVFLYLSTKKRPSTMLLLYVIFELVLCFSSYRNGSSVNALISYIISDMPMFLFALFIDYVLDKGRFLNFIHGMATIFTVLVTLNLLTILLFPNGLYQSSVHSLWNNNYFLGYRNVHLPFFAMALLSVGIMHFYKKSNNIFIVLIILLLSVFSLGSGTTLVAVLVAIACFLILYRKRDKPYFILRPTVLFVGSVLLTIGIVSGNIIKIIEPLISMIGKDVTFTGRIYIWQEVLLWISKSPIWGYGNDNDTLIARIGYGQSHNFYLDILYRGGTIYFSLFILIIILAFKNLKKVKGSILYDTITSTMVLFFIFFQQEGNHGKTLFFMAIYLAYCAPKIKKDFHKRKMYEFEMIDRNKMNDNYA